jgi:hypothetical protein
MPKFPKEFYPFSAISIKFSVTFSTEKEKVIQKFVWNHQIPQIAETILKKKNIAGGTWLQSSLQKL